MPPAASSHCPACGGTLHYWRTVPASDPALAPNTYDLYRCSTCGSARTGGPTLSANVYETGSYRPGTPRGYALARPILSAFDRHRLAMLKPVAPPPANLLDLGAGRGRFVAAAHAAGYGASGVEPSSRGARAAQALGVAVQQATIETAHVEEGSLDAITIWHVLEHLDDPAAALRTAGTWLRPNGVVLIGVPNLASLQARVGGARWFHLEVPRHRTHFTPTGLHALLRAAGFTPLKTHHLLAEHNPYGMWQSAVNRLTGSPSYLFNLLKRNSPPNPRDLAVTLAALPLAPLAALAELAAGVAGRGGTIAVLARRDGAPAPGS